jgi:hypothetical protein
MLAPSTPRIGRAGRWADSERQRTCSEQADSEWARGYRPSAPEAPESDGSSTVGPAGRENAHTTNSGTDPSLAAAPRAGGPWGCLPAAAAVARAATPRAAPPQGPAAASCLGRTSPLQSGPAIVTAERVSLPGEEMNLKAPMPRRGGAHCREEGRGRPRRGRAGDGAADDAAGLGRCSGCG